MELGNMIVDENGALELQMERILLHAVYNYVLKLPVPKKPSQFVLAPHDFELLYKQASAHEALHKERNGTYYWHDILISADPSLVDGTLKLLI